MTQTSNTESAVTAQTRNIIAGSRKTYLLSRCLLYTFAFIVFLAGIRLLCWTFLSFGVNAYLFRLTTVPVLVLLLSAICGELYRVATVSYYVEDGVLLGSGAYIDLWNLADVRYGAHCVYLNRTALPYVAKPKVFLESLEEIYFNLTGEYLP